jgi:hypothetical protein
MGILRTVGTAAVAAGLLGTTLAAPTSAQTQTGGNNRGGTGCTQQATTGNQNQAGGGRAGGQRLAGDQALGGLIDAALQDVQVLNNISAQVQALQGNLSVVCLNDTLNGNQLQVLDNILNNSPILNNNLNNSLNNLSALNNLNLLGGARVLAVDLTTGNVYVLGR